LTLYFVSGIFGPRVFFKDEDVDGNEEDESEDGMIEGEGGERGRGTGGGEGEATWQKSRD
jgi:hypothetical protein